MNLRIFVTITLFFMVSSLFAQTKINNYKYVIVPKKYDFLKENDQFQLNSLSEFLFKKYGFLALMEGSNYPEDLTKDRCLALRSNILKDSGMFKTKLAIELKDCNDQVIYTSNMGESREKEYQRAYTEALRNTFKHLELLNYSYTPTNSLSTTVQNTSEINQDSNEIQQLKQEIENLKMEKEAALVENAEPIAETVPQVAVVKEVPNSTPDTVKSSHAGILYAQAIENGFQLVDSSPKVVYKIKKTGITDVYLVENKNATLYKKDAHWFLEYYENNVLKQEILDIKF